MSDSPSNGKQPSSETLPASAEPNQIEVVARDDIMFLRIAKIGKAVMDFYDFVADKEPEKVEEFFTKYPKTAAAKMKIAPIAFARLIPIKFKEERSSNPRPLRRLSSEEFKALDLSKQQLTRLAEGETK